MTIGERLLLGIVVGTGSALAWKAVDFAIGKVKEARKLPKEEYPKLRPLYRLK